MTNKLEGVVQAVGDKFNGSLKIGDKWIANKKGFKNPAKVGDMVVLTLTPWDFNGKKGENITGVDVLAVPVEAPKAVAENKTVKPAQSPQGRDFDAEARGKCRHGMIVSLLPLVATQTISSDRAKEVVNELLEFVMKG